MIKQPCTYREWKTASSGLVSVSSLDEMNESCSPDFRAEWKYEEIPFAFASLGTNGGFRDFYFIEYLAKYNQGGTGNPPMPTTIKRYVLGLQRSFDSEWSYEVKLLESPTFNCKEEGFLSVVDNCIHKVYFFTTKATTFFQTIKFLRS